MLEAIVKAMLVIHRGWRRMESLF